MRKFAVVSSLAIMLCMACASRAADGLRTGAAAVDITPPVGTPMAGYYFERKSEGVHDDLFAKAIVLEQAALRGDRRTRPDRHLEGMVEDTRRDRADHKIPGRNVLIGATMPTPGPSSPDRVQRC